MTHGRLMPGIREDVVAKVMAGDYVHARRVELVEAAQRLREDGYLIRYIAETLCVSERTVNRLLQG